MRCGAAEIGWTGLYWLGIDRWSILLQIGVDGWMLHLVELAYLQ
jgi:hypothetical protein